MKRYVIIFSLATLLMAGLNLRNRTALPTSADFPASEPTVLSQTDDARNMDIAREANSLFAPPSTNNVVSGENAPHNFQVRLPETVSFNPQPRLKIDSGPSSGLQFLTVACNGVFQRAADYYVYSLRRIVI